MGTVNGFDITISGSCKASSEYCSFNIKKPQSYTFNISVTKWPTGNCQLSSIAYMNQMLTHTSNKEDALAIIMECYRLIGLTPLLIIIDVNIKYAPTIEQYFDKIVHKHPYTSTNNSSMCLFIINLKA